MCLERPQQPEREGHREHEEGAGQREGSGSLQQGVSKALAEPHSTHAWENPPEELNNR